MADSTQIHVATTVTFWFDVIAIPVFVLGLIFLIGIVIAKNLNSRRKAVVYVVFSGFGQMMLLINNFLESQDTFSKSTWASFVLHYAGIGVTIWPMLFRGWRIVCLFSSTIEFPIIFSKGRPWIRFQWRVIGSLTRKKRGHSWMLKRICIALLPYILVLAVFSLVFLGDSVRQIEQFDERWSFFLDGLEVGGCICTALVVVALFIVRAKVTKIEALETRTLCVFTSILWIFLMADLILWYGFVGEKHSSISNVQFSIIKNFIVLAMFISSVGFQVVHQAIRLCRKKDDVKRNLQLTHEIEMMRSTTDLQGLEVL